MHGQAHTPRLTQCCASRPARSTSRLVQRLFAACWPLGDAGHSRTARAACPHDAASGSPTYSGGCANSEQPGAAPNICGVLEAYNGHANQPPIPLADLVAALQDLRTPQPLRRPWSPTSSVLPAWASRLQERQARGSCGQVSEHHAPRRLLRTSCSKDFASIHKQAIQGMPGDLSLYHRHNRPRVPFPLRGGSIRLLCKCLHLTSLMM